MRPPIHSSISFLIEAEGVDRVASGDADQLPIAGKSKYLSDQKWQSLVSYGERRAKELGISEDDVPRLVEEVRKENQTRGR